MIKTKRRLRLEAAFLFVRQAAWSAGTLSWRSRTRPFGPRRCLDHRHANAVGCAKAECADIEILQAKDVDAEMVGRGALAMKRVDAAARAEEVLRAIRVPDVSRQQIFAAEDR